MSLVAKISGLNLISESGTKVYSQNLIPCQLRFKHQPALDGLRAVAVLYVMGFHSTGPVGNYLARGGGWTGVDIFFVISGFLITSILLQEKARNGFINFKSFYFRRMLRLMPAYWAYLAFIAVVNPKSCPHIGTAIGIALIYLSNYDLGLGWNHTMGSGTEPSWSLALEEQFYLLWPMALNLFRKHLTKFIIGCIIACEVWKAWLLTHGTSWMQLEANFDTKFDTLMFGALGASLYSDVRYRNLLNKYLSSKVVSVLLFVLLLVFVRVIGHPSAHMNLVHQIFYWNLRLPLFAAASSALILNLCVQPNSPIAKFLSMRVFTSIGRLSYSIYLWHGLTFLALESVLKSVLEKWQVEIICYVAAIAVAWLSYHLIEKPFLRIKNSLN